MKFIGIDLGTTHSCVAVYEKGKMEVFENDHGRRTTPSYVAFTDHESFVGNEAKLYCIEDPNNVVFDSKRLIGRRFNEHCVQEDIKRNWPFTVINENGTPMIQVKYLKKSRTFIPEFISAKILEYMKKIGKYKLGVDPTGAVITVPAYFSDCQREATKAAALIAGFQGVRLLNEPTAAAIAYTLNNKDMKESNIVVFDLGGGTFDVSVLTVKNGRIIVKAVNGDTHLGGNDFDDLLMEYFLDEIKKKFKRDLRSSKYKKSLSKLRHACETAKISLSGMKHAKLVVDALVDGKDFKSEIIRAKFEGLCDELMRKTLIPIEKALNDAKLTIADIDDILLVGGSARIPKIQNLVQEFFGGKELNTRINPEEAVACGAAVLAAILQNDCNEDIVCIKLNDIIPLSYGIEQNGSLMSFIIPRNTQYPIKIEKAFKTSFDNQKDGTMNIYQGERKIASENQYLGTLFIDNLPQKPAEEVFVDATMEINEDGVLVLTVVERSTGVRANVTITNAIGRLSENEIQKLIAEAQTMKEHDLKYKEMVETKNELETFINSLRRSLKENDKNLKKADKNNVNKLIREYEKIMNEKCEPSLDDLKFIIQKLEEQLELCGTICFK